MRGPEESLQILELLVSSPKILNLKNNSRNFGFLLTVYSSRNSDSIACRRFSSNANSKEVSTGSLELNAIRELAERALYAFIRDCEYRKESVSCEETQSSHPHLR